MSTLSYVKSFIRPFRWHLVGLIALTGVLSIFAMLPPLLVRDVINRVITAGEHERLFGVSFFLIGTAIAATACGYLQVLGTAFVGQSFVMRIRMAVYSHMLRLGMAYFGRESTGKLINKLMGDSSTLQQILSVATMQVVSDLVCAIFAITATLFINWRLAVPLFLLLILFVVNYKLSIGRLKKLTRAFRGAEDRVAAGVQDRLATNMTVKTYGTEERENALFSEQSQASMDLSREAQVATGMFSTNVRLLSDVGRVVIYFLGCAMVLSGSASYGDVTAFSAYAMQLLWPAVRFSQLAQQLENVRISAERLFEILDEQPQIIESSNPQDIGKAQGEVSLKDVVFSYVPGKPVLRGISFDVKPGETVALVGPTGCGKTTVLSLLMRLYDIDSGSITIDGTDVRDLSFRCLRQQFGIVLQESMLFTISIADNISYARPSATREQVEAAARVAEIHEDIIRLPQGYDSVYGERDVQLSVGQKQRLAIARAVLADPAILVMDEATSALDSKSERAIQIAMERFLKDRTAFIVAHRLSTIRNAHHIILLDGGVIVEHGTHESLLDIPGGRYRHLYETYAGKGVIEEE
ncbi:MAG: ABC transporter ATP-binding protein [Lentisphaerae bacterium]|nr:ABC transporter ATP-binding protein [Lentisphaerota bacterium]